MRKILNVSFVVLALTTAVMALPGPKPPTVPEPATLTLLGSGIAAVAVWLRKGRK
jgi:hypothetical protein